MKTKKVKGFTLVELIVVIAIIGVLAAILVPSMLGYVKKSKVSAANSNAKSLSNAVATAVTEVDTAGGTIPDGQCTYGDGNQADLDAQILKYFSGVTNLEAAGYELSSGAILSCAVKDGQYWGTNPKQTTTDNATTQTDMAAALTYGKG